MTAAAFLAISAISNAKAEIFDELDIEYVGGRIHNAFEAHVDGEDVVLLCGTMGHVDAMKADEVTVTATYLGRGEAGYPRFLVKSAEPIAA